ncbi:D-alanine--D-alanine ligase [Croceitalea sp. MTPC9]|uniref:D-alanine--D-alanine ligase n=1 Tax=unclassified Croceitalea TaxID=2632280 RepID=UPI002B379B55|nr:D-alanine--D-alanine ligase [Croceitalea sp. MTPC6]GMN18414.1 D-alanine--D-alanine ligase [Croceitalea sp. MTPC9]
MDSLRLKWHKLTHWEYWPLWAIYYPLFPVWVFLSIKARSFFFFNAANPSMKNGGMAMESKNDIYNLIPNEYIPKTILIERETALEDIEKQIASSKINFPFIAKPDIGMKAYGVDKIHDLEDLQLYIDRTPTNFLVQELIPYAKEVGIFYVRIPGEKSGKITGIVAKEFLSVIGDGKRSILELIKNNPRSHFQLYALTKKFGSKLDQVLKEGEEFILVPYGSHTRGAKFIDKSAETNPSLEKIIDAICMRMPEFYYGRLDVLYDNFQDLSQGQKFKIIEINGAGGEATHIYDPKHSLFFAWKEIFKHWNYLCKISIINHKRGYPYLSFKDGRAMLKANSLLEEQLKLV